MRSVQDSHLGSEIVTGRTSGAIPQNFRRLLTKSNTSRARLQTAEWGDQDIFFRIRHSVFVSVEGRYEEVLHGVVEVTELRVYEGLHPCGDLIYLAPFVATIGSQRAGVLMTIVILLR